MTASFVHGVAVIGSGISVWLHVENDNFFYLKNASLNAVYAALARSHMIHFSGWL
jgi:hypothetical protein